MKENTTILKIYTLGGVRFILNGVEVHKLSTRKVQALAIYLASTGQPQPRESLADLLWDDRTQTRALSNLRVALSNLRKHLGSFFHITRDFAAVNPNADVWLDAERLVTASAIGLDVKSQGFHGAPGELEAALALYQGPFLQGFSVRGARLLEDWVTVERERLHQMVTDGYAKVVSWYLENQDYPTGIRHTKQWLQLDPLNETAHQSMMRQLAYNGQVGAAIHQYQECIRLLDEELGLGPSPMTIALYENLKAGNLLPPQEDSSPIQAAIRHGQVQELALPAFLETDGHGPMVDEVKFIGREKELAYLLDRLEHFLAGEGGVTFVTGEAGRGKTTLLQEFSRRAQSRIPDLIIATVASPIFSRVSAPYAIFRDIFALFTGDIEDAWLSGQIDRKQAVKIWHFLPTVLPILYQKGRNLLGTLVPTQGLIQRAMSVAVDPGLIARLEDVDVHTREKTVHISQQGELFAEITAVIKALSEEQPLLLIMDDIHWLDPASIGMFSYLGDRLQEMQIMLVGVYRREDIEHGRDEKTHPLMPILNEYKRRFGDVWLTLNEVTDDNSRDFIDAYLDLEPNNFGEQFRKSLAYHTGGNALFTVELLREMKRRAIIEKDPSGRWDAVTSVDWEIMPPRVEGVIETRVNRLDPELRSWLAMASVEGELFSVEVLARLTGKSEATIVKRLGGDLARKHHLIHAAGIQRTGSQLLSRYQFRHNLFRHYLYDQLDDIERRFLHEQVGEALEKLLHDHTDEMADQLAHHFQLAGNDDKTLHYLIKAADEASRLYATNQAAAYYVQVLELAERISIPAAELINLHLKFAFLLETLGDFDHSIDESNKALKISRENNRQKLEWQALLGLGKTYTSQDYSKAGDYFEKALALARTVDDPGLIAQSLNGMGNWYSNTNKLKKALEAHEQAFETYDKLQDKQGMADTSDLISWVYYYHGDFVQASSYFDRAIAYYRELDDRAGLTSTLANRGSMGAYYEFHPVPSVNPIKASIPFLEESYEIATDIGWRSQQSYALWSLATRYFANGDFGRGIGTIKEALDIAFEINHKYWITGELYDLGLMYCGLNAADEAKHHLEEALPLSQEIQSEHFSNQIHGALAKAYLLKSDLANAKLQLEAVLTEKTPMDTISQRYCWALWAELSLHQGNAEKSVVVVDKLIRTIPGILPDRVNSSLWRLRGEALGALGQMEEAEADLLAALENAMSLDEGFILWRIYVSLGSLYQRMNREAEADSAFQTAQTLTSELADTVQNQTVRATFERAVSDLLEGSKL